MRNINRLNVQDIRLTERPARDAALRHRAEVGLGILDPIRAAGRSVANAAARWRARRAVRADLAALPDWALADIGLARSDIAQVADAIADKLREAGPGPDGRPPKIQLQSLVHDDPLTGHVRVVAAGTPGLAGCG